MISETSLPKTIFEVIEYLYDANLFSLKPSNIAIIREGRREIFPCARAYPEGLDLRQLEWAARTGDFWFLGPIKGVRVLIDKGAFQGKLFLGLNEFVYETTINELNFVGFRNVVNKLRSIATKEGLDIMFHKSHYGYHNVDLTLTHKISLSAENVSNFLTKIKRLLSQLQMG